MATANPCPTQQVLIALADAYRSAMAGLEAVPHLAVMVPTALGLVVASRRSLRNWVAVQAAPPKAADPIARWKKVVGALLLVAVVFGLEYTVLLTSAASIVLRFVTACFQQSALMVFALYLTGGAQLTVTRVEGRAPRFGIVREPAIKRKVLALLLPVSIINVASLSLPNYHPVNLYVSTALVVHLSSSRPPAPAITLRALTVGLLCAEVLLLTLSAMVTCMLLAASDTPLPQFSLAAFIGLDDGTSLPISDVLTSSGFSRVLVAIWLTWQSTLVSTCLRFDYAQYLERSSIVPEALQITDTGAVMVPRRAPRVRKPRYFMVSLISVIGSQVATSHLLAKSGLEMQDDITFALISMLLGIPVACLSIIALAGLRGELGAFCRYREQWIAPKGSQPIALPDTKDEEALPAYEEPQTIAAADEKA